MNDPESVLPSAPAPELSPLPQPESPVRRFFRDTESAGNLEDGMEFHAAGIVVGTASDSSEAEIIVLYLNPFTAKVERRGRTLASVILYEFPQDDGVYWRLWDQTRAKLESLESSQ